VQRIYFNASWMGSLPSPVAHRGWKVFLLFIQRFQMASLIGQVYLFDIVCITLLLVIVLMIWNEGID
jgi:hypothetical protein